jgi:rod shape determining protein RodA
MSALRRWVGDVWVFGAAVTLAGAGGVAIASASATLNPLLTQRQLLWIGLGLSAYVLVCRTSRRWWVSLGPAAYGLAVVLLVAVWLAGQERLGAARWLSVFGMSIQPSEAAKLALVLLLSQTLAGQPSPLPPRVIWGSLALTALPAALIFRQPDLGTTTVLGAIWLGIVWVAGIPRRALAALLGAAAALTPLGWLFLKEYQRARLLAFLDPQADPLGAGYTLIQSTIAIGSGGLWGKGWRAGTQSQLNFLPERHSDFIVSVIGEEWGLLGCLVVLGAIGALLWRLLAIGEEAPSPQGRLLAAGVCAWVGYQALVNMGMAMGLLPVVGVPLPLVSYGGTSMVAVWLALALAVGAARDAVAL